jgi:hypothetical protein
MIRQRVGQCPQEEQHDRQMHEQLQEREAQHFAGEQPEHAQERQHPERVDGAREQGRRRFAPDCFLQSSSLQKARTSSAAPRQVSGLGWPSGYAT